MRARLRWSIGIVFFLFTAGYLIGGTRGYTQMARNIRARMRVMLEPPTEREIQRAAIRDSVNAEVLTAAVERVRKQMPAGQPASPALAISVSVGIIVAALGLMFLTSKMKS